MTLFEALTGGAFDRLNWQHSGEFDQNFSKKSNAPGFARGRGGWAILELTGTLNRLVFRWLTSVPVLLLFCLFFFVFFSVVFEIFSSVFLF